MKSPSLLFLALLPFVSLAIARSSVPSTNRAPFDVTGGLGAAPSLAMAWQRGAGLAGSYNIVAATTPDGAGSYRGVVQIKPLGKAFDLTWTVNDSGRYRGVGLEVDGILAVGWSAGERYGVAVYRIGSGALGGLWTASGLNGEIGTETLEGPANLNGAYKITRGALGSQTYSGTATIAPAGEIYQVKWELPNRSDMGIGFRQGNLLIVGWGQADLDAGVIAYRINAKAGALDGRWANPRSSALGTEKLIRASN